MKLQAERLEGQNAISRHSAEGVVVNGVEFRHSLVVPWRGAVLPWPVVTFDALETSHFEAVLALAPELVVFGSGQRIRFPRPALTQAFMARRIGIETMDTQAACRTYNVLLSEGRSVVAALLFEAGEGR